MLMTIGGEIFKVTLYDTVQLKRTNEIKQTNTINSSNPLLSFGGGVTTLNMKFSLVSQTKDRSDLISLHHKIVAHSSHKNNKKAPQRVTFSSELLKNFTFVVNSIMAEFKVLNEEEKHKILDIDMNCTVDTKIITAEEYIDKTINL